MQSEIDQRNDRPRSPRERFFVAPAGSGIMEAMSSFTPSYMLSPLFLGWSMLSILAPVWTLLPFIGYAIGRKRLSIAFCLVFIAAETLAFTARAAWFTWFASLTP